MVSNSAGLRYAVLLSPPENITQASPCLPGPMVG
jgi:hypothetical protein